MDLHITPNKEESIWYDRKGRIKGAFKAHGLGGTAMYLNRYFSEIILGV